MFGIKALVNRIESLEFSRICQFEREKKIIGDILKLDNFIIKSRHDIMEIHKDIELMKMALDYEKVASSKRIGSKKKATTTKKKGQS